MKFLKNFLLTASLVVTTMGMSLSANAVLIQQDIFIDVLPGDSFDTGLGLTDTLEQLIGSVRWSIEAALIRQWRARLHLTAQTVQSSPDPWLADSWLAELA